MYFFNRLIVMRLWFWRKLCLLYAKRNRDMLLPIRYIACLFATVGAASLHTNAQNTLTPDTLTLERSIALALEHNRDVQQSHTRTRGEAINLRQTKQNLLPSLEAGMSHSYSQGRFINPTTNQYVEENFTSGNQHVSSSLILFDGLRMFRNITQQAHAYRATQLEEQLMEEQVALDVTAAYINVLTSKDMVAQIDSQVAVTQQQVERSTVLFDEGAIAPGDYYDLKGKYASDLNNLNTAKKKWKNSCRKNRWQWT